MGVLKALDDDLRKQCDSLCAQIDAIIAKQEARLSGRRPNRNVQTYDAAYPPSSPRVTTTATNQTARAVSNSDPSVTACNPTETPHPRIRNVRSMIW